MLQNTSLKSQLIFAFFIMALVSGLTGGGGMYFIKSVGHSGQEISDEFAPRADAAMEVIRSTSEAYIAYEQAASGSVSGLEEIWRSLDKANWYSDAILNGNAGALGTFKASQDNSVLDKARQLKQHIHEFKTALEARVDVMDKAVSAGSLVDAQFDEKYELIQEKLTDLAKQSNEVGLPQSANAASESKYLLANAHLFLEEYLGGDDTLTAKDVRAYFVETVTAVNRIAASLRQRIDLNAEVQAFVDIVETRIENFQSNQSLIKESGQTLDQSFNSLLKTAEAMESLIHKNMEVAQRELHGRIGTATIGMLTIVALGIGMAAVFALLILKAITNPLKECMDVASRIAEGDLNVAVTGGENETGQLLNAINKMAGNLQHTVGKVKQNSDVLMAGSRGLSEASNSIAKTAVEQAENLNSISHSIEESANNIRATADNASEATLVAAKTQKSAEGGNAWMSRMMDSMRGIHGSSDQISQIIGTIDEIAFQTNLLALNAAVEAARAGEQGRGFAVVATEVRNLAQRSAQAANETKLLIEESRDKAHEGMRIAERTADSLKEIVDGTKEVTLYIEDIAKSSCDQRESVDLINQGVNEINLLIQQNARISGQSAKSSQNLLQVSEDLQNVVARFKTQSDSPRLQASFTHSD